MFDFNTKTDEFGFTQATLESGGVFYYIDFLPCDNRLIILCDSWLNIDKPREAMLHTSAKYEMNY